MTPIVYAATTNLGKLREFRQVLEPLGYEVRGLEDYEPMEVVEDGDTFTANAIKKAEAWAQIISGVVIADDSGLAVDYLDGAPGVHSARYAGVEGPGEDQANRDKLLGALQGVPAEQRTARFVCVLALLQPGLSPVTFDGLFEGSIGTEERGENGFGYDSIFIVQGDTRTSAEMAPEEKNALSHRGDALRLLAEHLKVSPL